jgi:hypothetical protein
VDQMTGLHHGSFGRKNCCTPGSRPLLRLRLSSLSSGEPPGPRQGRYQRKLVGPYIAVVHPQISAPPRNVVVRLNGVTERRGGQRRSASAGGTRITNLPRRLSWSSPVRSSATRAETRQAEPGHRRTDSLLAFLSHNWTGRSDPASYSLCTSRTSRTCRGDGQRPRRRSRAFQLGRSRRLVNEHRARRPRPEPRERMLPMSRPIPAPRSTPARRRARWPPYPGIVTAVLAGDG